MPTFDTIKRATPRVEVLRGYDPCETTTQTAAYPVATGATILSGQIVSPKWDGEEYVWVVGHDTADATNAQQPYIAINDSEDEDVIEAGNLPGLSCSGQFEVETAFFKTGETYKIGVLLTYDGVTGDVKPAAVGDFVVGEVTRNFGLKNLQGINSNVEKNRLDVIAYRTINPGKVTA